MRITIKQRPQNWSVISITKPIIAVTAHPQRLEEPPVLAVQVTLLEQLFNGLLGICSFRGLLKSLHRSNPLQTLQIKRVTCGEEVGVIDRLPIAR